MRKFTDNRIYEEMYKYNPSKKRTQAKDVSLLAKLAPYKSEKKRPYECRELQNQLAQEAKEDRSRKKDQIKNYKKF